jgi:hypothetical protein
MKWPMARFGRLRVELLRTPKSASLRGMLASLHRRLSKLEARRPAQGPAQLIDPSLLDPAVLALWLAVDIDHMTLDQLDLLEDNLGRLTV